MQWDSYGHVLAVPSPDQKNSPAGPGIDDCSGIQRHHVQEDTW